MSSYLDSIPQAVATIVSACIAQGGTALKPEVKDTLAAWAVDLTDKLTRTLAKGLREAGAEK